MKLKLHFFALIIVLTAISSGANAAFVNVTLNPKVMEGTLNLDGALGPLRIKFEGDSIVEQVWFSNSQAIDLHDQNPTTIKAAVEHQFGVTGLESSGEGTINGSRAEIATLEPFSYLAIHFGRHELFFKFASAIDEFEITTNGRAAGLSNYRAFDKPSEVPLPAAVWLFASALAGLGVMKRKPS